MVRILTQIGGGVREAFLKALDISAFFVYAVRSIAGFYQRRGLKSTFNVVLRQIKFTGLDAMPYIILIAILLGSLVIIQALPQLSQLGAGPMLGKLLVIAIIRELGPLITAVVVIARSGTAISAELGTSKVLREIEALESMGINPFHYTIAPRIIAAVISVFCLTMYFDLVAIFGGYLVATTRLILPFTVFADYVLGAMTGMDIYLSVIKSMVFGAIIALSSCYFGMAVRRSPTEIPQAVTKGVISSLIMVFITSFIISYMVYV